MLDTSTVNAADVLSIPAAHALVGGLSETSKMPCFSYNLPAVNCKVGSKLQTLPGSTCGSCYALKGRYLFPNVKRAMERRLASITHPLWAGAMAMLLNYLRTRNHGKQYDLFRWHDSGDVQDIDHLVSIVKVCNLTPAIKHWLPTREITIVQAYLALHGSFPTNLVVRISAPMIGASIAGLPDLPISTVGLPGVVEDCKAYEQGGVCGECRICWTSSSVNYPKH